MHKKEIAGAGFAFIMQLITGSMLANWFSALGYGALGWVGAKLIELVWMKIKNAIKKRNNV